MRRIVIAFLLTPILAAVALAIVTLEPYWIFFASIFMYPLMLVLGVPAFLLFRKLGWLRWWHATIAGLLVSIAFAWYFDSNTNPYHFEMDGWLETSLYITAGYLTALIFWFIALYKNPSYPNALSRYAYLSIVPLAMLVATTNYLNRVLETTDVRGTITALLPPVKQKPMARVDLEDGKTADIRLLCYQSYHVGDLIDMDYRRRSWLFEERYWAEEVIQSPGTRSDTDAREKEDEACYKESLAPASLPAMR